MQKMRIEENQAEEIVKNTEREKGADISENSLRTHTEALI